MHNFDLHWPKTTAFLNTDGQRCRIIWRAGTGMGGTIDNNALCKKRLAEGLNCAPGLLEELRSAGYGVLAEEIARLAPPPEGMEERRRRPPEASAASGAIVALVQPEQVEPPERVEPEEPARPEEPAKPRDEADVMSGWVAALAGDVDWQSCGTRRAKSWKQVAAEGTDGAFDALFLKTPGMRGKSDWVMKRVPNAGGSPEYVSSVSFRGICAYLTATQPYSSVRFLDAFTAECASLATDFSDVRAALDAWQSQPR